MFKYLRQNPNLRGLIFQQAFFGLPSAIILCLSAILAFAFPGVWWLVLAGGALLWLGNLLLQLNSEAIYKQAVAFEVGQGFISHANSRFNVEELDATLEGLLQSIKGRVPTKIFEQVKGIRATIAEILPYTQRLDLDWQDAFNLRETITEYLPTTLENYLKLSPRMAEQKMLTNGKTAQVLLNEQLTLLDSSLKDMLDSLHRNDTEQLQVQGRFLRDKFSKGANWTQ